MGADYICRSRKMKLIVRAMLPTRQGSFRLFRFAGVNVFLHWSWLAVALLEINWRSKEYSSPLWNALEYVALFVIVTMHEFGHALACRSVGGKADQIVLWPLGGVAYVDPPRRPGATLWSIAAGPLVNVVLAPVLSVLAVASRQWTPDVHNFIHAVCLTNFVLLFFNMLPVYPLDGGQILQSLLWFWLGRARSLLVTAVFGFVGVAGLVGLAVWAQNVWFGVIAGFVGIQCWKGYKFAQALLQLERMPRHTGAACPACHAAPPQGLFWRCNKCGTAFDTFVTGAACPKCATQFAVTRCVDCGASSPLAAWLPVPPTTY
jgi:Zn-dependent protease